MVLHVSKKGIRVLGVAESFKRGEEKSVLAGVVMRSDHIIDGVTFDRITVGGMDATDGILRLFKSLQRDDVNVLMLNGCVISWFNIVDIRAIYEKLRIPLICVTYEESDGLEEHITRHFAASECDLRIPAYRMLGNRVPVKLHDNFEVLIRFLGMQKAEAGALLKKFTLHGKLPEPLRVAKIAARAIIRTNKKFVYA
jgi:endonuclease V-like protein UPF0215 family